jgi:hypothetical protein
MDGGDSRCTRQTSLRTWASANFRGFVVVTDEDGDDDGDGDVVVEEVGEYVGCTTVAISGWGNLGGAGQARGGFLLMTRMGSSDRVREERAVM